MHSLKTALRQLPNGHAVALSEMNGFPFNTWRLGREQKGSCSVFHKGQVSLGFKAPQMDLFSSR